MRWQAAWMGLTIVFALVVGSLADQPSPVVSPGEVGPADGFPQIGASAGPNLLRVGSAGELIGFSGFDGSGSQTITLVHTGKMQMAVYHIDRSGQVRLVSSRPIDADFSLTLNATAPLPGEIRLLSGQVK
ncbi:hypothetical protein FYK55_09055 [Roseiconus nitratireducens]|uniref:Uncharacterized protein n=1 Tax=Roseiconus nitratireducens TaxID=2605748 RepID=A0A5M6DE78_9BACT|nr:hypothetical protein [Roseiconus nitratireducens]KAA5544469.1 hypothetical protein FYK55_09055 [Roseiconus nitratireducens]